MKISPLIIGSAAVVIIAIIAGAVVLSKRTSTPQISATPNASVVNQNVEQKNVEDETPTVPLPQEEDIIRAFFNLINEGRAADAISMMTQAAIGTDSSKQAWGVQFNSFKSVSVNKIEPSMQEEWTATEHTYKVTLDVQMKPEAASASIPNYGWDNGQNIRFLPLEKVDNLWKIVGIATGP